MDYVTLFLIHWPLPTLYDGDFVATWKVLEEFHREGRALDRSVQLPGRAPAAAGRRVRDRAGRQPDRGSPVLHQRRGPRLRSTRGIATGGVVAHRSRCRAHRPGDRKGGREGGQDGCSGRAALAHPARRHRVPEVDDARTHQGELRALRLRARGGGRRSAHCTGPGEAGRTCPNPDTFDYLSTDRHQPGADWPRARRSPRPAAGPGTSPAASVAGRCRRRSWHVRSSAGAATCHRVTGIGRGRR